MYCDNCGCEIPENEEECPVCGKKFSKVTPKTDYTQQTEEDDTTTVLTASDRQKEDDVISEAVNIATQYAPEEKEVPTQNNPDLSDLMIKKKGEKNGLSKGAKITLITIPIVVVLAVGVLAFLYVPKFRDYNNAEEKLSTGEIDEAVELYKGLGDFKDSLDKANGGAYYEYAASLEGQGRNLEAAEYYAKSAKYKYSNAADKASQCYYTTGIDQMGAGSYDSAIEAFKNAGSYNDAADKVTECIYKSAEALVNAGDYDAAIEKLTGIEEYGDAKTLLSQCYYNKAAALLEAGSYDEAYDMFIKSEYDDYSDKANESMYQKAVKLYNEQDYENALESYQKVDSGYKNCVADIDKCYIALGNQAYKDGEYKQAVEYFEGVSKTNVDKKIDRSKLAYAKANLKTSNLTTMTYLGELRYAGNEKAQELYSQIVRWDIKSFVNDSESDIENQNNTIKNASEIYIHTMFTIDGDDTMTISGYVIYSDGRKSDQITFSDEVVDGWSTWVNISGDSAPKGTTYFVIENESASGAIIEVYPFTIK